MLNCIGFTIALIGGIIQVWGIGPLSSKFGEGGYTEDESGKRYEIAYVRSRDINKIGAILFILGSLIEMLDLVIK